MKGDFDPYQELIELKEFAKAADQHIANLLNNQKQFVAAINDTNKRCERIEYKIRQLEHRIDELKMSLIDLEEDPNETTR